MCIPQFSGQTSTNLPFLGHGAHQRAFFFECNVLGFLGPFWDSACAFATQASGGCAGAPCAALAALAPGQRMLPPTGGIAHISLARVLTTRSLGEVHALHISALTLHTAHSCSSSSSLKHPALPGHSIAPAQPVKAQLCIVAFWLASVTSAHFVSTSGARMGTNLHHGIRETSASMHRFNLL